MSDDEQPVAPKTKLEHELHGSGSEVDRETIYQFLEERNSFSVYRIVDDACDAFGLLWSCKKADQESPAMDLVKPAALQAQLMMVKAFLKVLGLEESDLEFELCYSAETIEDAVNLIKEEMEKKEKC